MTDARTTPATRWRAAAVIFAGLAGAEAIAAGAWAAHGFGGMLDARGAELVELAGRYGVWHALAILACVLLPATGWTRRLLDLAALAFVVGILGFSGGLHVSALGRAAGPLAPLGGTALILGWLLVAGAGLALLLRRRPD